MLTNKYIVDTNILIYHTKGLQIISEFLCNLIVERSFHVSILTKIEFLGWDKHSPEGFEKCKQLIESANIHHVDEDVANKTIEFKKENEH